MSKVELTVEDWTEWAQDERTKDFIRSLEDEKPDLIQGIIYQVKGDAREDLIGRFKAIDIVIDKIKELTTQPKKEKQ
jgi:hypothetical protein